MQESVIQRHLGILVPSWQFADVSDVEYLSGGYSNTNYALTHQDRRYVLRIPEREQPFVDRQHEAAWYAKLPQHIGVQPTALDVVTGSMLTPWVEGQLLADAYAQLQLEDLATYLQGLHAQLPQDTRVYDVTTVNRAFWQNQAVPYSVFEAPGQHLTTCHNDLNPWNILITESGWITLDWEFAGLNDPLFDLVSLHQGLELPLDSLQALACLTFGDMSPDLEQRLQDAIYAFWVRELGWAHFQISAGNERQEIVTQKQTALKILKSL